MYHIASDTWSLSSQEAMSSSSDCGAPSSEVAEEETSTHVKYATKAAGTATSSGLLVQFGGIAGSSVSGDVSIFVTGDRKCAELDSSFLFGASSGDSSFVLGAGGSAEARDLTNFNEGSCTNAAKFEKIWYWIGHEDGSSPSCVVGRGDDDYKLPTSSMQVRRAPHARVFVRTLCLATRAPLFTLHEWLTLFRSRADRLRPRSGDERGGDVVPGDHAYRCCRVPRVSGYDVRAQEQTHLQNVPVQLLGHVSSRGAVHVLE